MAVLDSAVAFITILAGVVGAFGLVVLATRPELLERVMARLWMALGGSLGGSPTLRDVDEAEAETRAARVHRLSSALSEALTFLSEIEKDIQSGQATATRLKQDISTYEQVVRVRREEVEAIAQVVRAGLREELRAEGHSRLPREVAIAVFSAILGAALSITITVILA